MTIYVFVQKPVKIDSRLKKPIANLQTRQTISCLKIRETKKIQRLLYLSTNDFQTYLY